MDERRVRKSYWIDADGPDPDAVRDAFRFATERCEDGGWSAAWVVVDTYKMLENATVIRDALGIQRFYRLAGSRQLTIAGVTFVVANALDFRQASSEGIAVLLYPHKNLLDLIDDAPGLECVIAVPFMREKLLPWVQTWEAIDIRTGLAADAHQVGATLELALEALTRFVNVRNEFLMTEDRRYAVELFKDVMRQGETLDGVTVRAWVLAEGWHSRGADRLAKLADDLASGKRVRL